MFEKILDKIKAHAKTIIFTAVSVFIVVLVIVTAAGRENKTDWASSPVTADIPEFTAAKGDIEIGEGFAVGYYENVTSAQIAEYESLLAEKLGMVFPPKEFPCAKEYDGRLIILHYNVTEMNFSVTVTKTDKDTVSEEQ